MADNDKAPSRKRIPRFRSIEEEAEFWDTHDSTEFESKFRPARVKFAHDLQHILEVTLPREVLTGLIEVARRRGTGPVALAAQLIAEGLDRLSSETESGGKSAKKGKQHG